MGNRSLRISISVTVVVAFWFLCLSAFADGESKPEGEFTGTSIKFEYPPVDISKILFIEPMGSVMGDHVTPIDHQYYKAPDHYKQNDARIVIDVYSPADGTIREMQHMGSFRGDYDHPPMDDYRIVIQHTDTISSAFIHVDKLSEKVAKAAPAFGKYTSANVRVKAGEVIGSFRGSVDYNVIDKDVRLKGFVVPEHYKSERWKIHVADPFNYFSEPIRKRLIAKCLRTAKPEGGKIDYDIDRRLVGSWFKENTNGYAGLNMNRYWADHLSIVYDSVDTDHVIVSIGTYNGRAEQFGVKGNSPDPAQVSIQTGMVKYELVMYDFFDGGNHWNRDTLAKGLEARNDFNVRGVALFQMIKYRKLKAEFFPGKRASQVSGFTSAASIYER